jgi:hypothetical protein
MVWMPPPPTHPHLSCVFRVGSHRSSSGGGSGSKVQPAPPCAPTPSRGLSADHFGEGEGDAAHASPAVTPAALHPAAPAGGDAATDPAPPVGVRPAGNGAPSPLLVAAATTPAPTTASASASASVPAPAARALQASVPGGAGVFMSPPRPRGDFDSAGTATGPSAPRGSSPDGDAGAPVVAAVPEAAATAAAAPGQASPGTPASVPRLTSTSPSAGAMETVPAPHNSQRQQSPQSPDSAQATLATSLPELGDEAAVAPTPPMPRAPAPSPASAAVAAAADLSPCMGNSGGDSGPALPAMVLSPVPVMHTTTPEAVQPAEGTAPTSASSHKKPARGELPVAGAQCLASCMRSGVSAWAGLGEQGRADGGGVCGPREPPPPRLAATPRRPGRV